MQRVLLIKLLILSNQLWPLLAFSSEENELCIDQPNDTVMAHPSICCNVYLRCENGAVNFFECPEQFWFNSYTEKCERLDDEADDVLIDNNELNVIFNDELEELEETISTNLPVSSIPLFTTPSTEAQTTPSTSPVTSIPLFTTKSTEAQSTETASTSPLPVTSIPLFTTKSTVAQSTETPSTNPQTSSNIVSLVPPTRTTTKTTTKPPVQCPVVDTILPTFLSSPEYCDNFFICYHGQPIEMFCSAGFSWNEQDHKCVPEIESNCLPHEVAYSPRCPQVGQHFFPHPDVCEQFLYCENGIRSVQKCDAFYHWDVYENRCMLKMFANCIKNLPKSQSRKFFN